MENKNKKIFEKHVKLLTPYLKDPTDLLENNHISLGDLQRATRGAYPDALAGKLSYDDLFWILDSLLLCGVWLSKGFGEVYNDRNTIKALEEIVDPRPYIHNPTEEQKREQIEKGA